MRPPGHDCGAMPRCHCREARNGCAQISFNQRQAIADLQHQGAIHDVLRGGAPMGPAPGIFARQFGELIDQPHHRIASIAGGGGQGGAVQCFGARHTGDGGGRLGRDDPKRCLRARQRRFHIQHLLQIGVFAKGSAHGVRAIKRAQHGAVSGVYGHGFLRMTQ